MPFFCFSHLAVLSRVKSEPFMEQEVLQFERKRAIFLRSVTQLHEYKEPRGEKKASNSRRNGEALGFPGNFFKNVRTKLRTPVLPDGGHLLTATTHNKNNSAAKFGWIQWAENCFCILTDLIFNPYYKQGKWTLDPDIWTSKHYAPSIRTTSSFYLM